jgi:hypothetical protein
MAASISKSMNGVKPGDTKSVGSLEAVLSYDAQLPWFLYPPHPRRSHCAHSQGWVTVTPD